jgi:hypothetical protein
MFGNRWFRKVGADMAAVLLKLRRLPEVDHVRIDIFPADEQMVFVPGFDAALHFMRYVTGNALNDGLGLGEARFEFGTVSRLDFENGDFQYHEFSRDLLILARMQSRADVTRGRG